MAAVLLVYRRLLIIFDLILTSSSPNPKRVMRVCGYEAVVEMRAGWRVRVPSSRCVCVCVCEYRTSDCRTSNFFHWQLLPFKLAVGSSRRYY